MIDNSSLIGNSVPVIEDVHFYSHQADTHIQKPANFVQFASKYPISCQTVSPMCRTIIELILFLLSSTLIVLLLIYKYPFSINKYLNIAESFAIESSKHQFII